MRPMRAAVCITREVYFTQADGSCQRYAAPTCSRLRLERRARMVTKAIFV